MVEATSTFKQLIELSQRRPLVSQRFFIEKLKHYSQYSDRILVVCGKSGSGVSTSLAWLAETIDKPADALLANAEEADWVERTFRKLNINTSNIISSLTFIHENMEVFLIIDNGDNLSNELLDALAEKARLDYFHCVLAVKPGSPAHQWAIENEDRVLMQGVEPLPEEDIRTLLVSKLQLSDKQADILLNEHTVTKIIKRSGGRPGVAIDWAQKILSQSGQSIINRLIPSHLSWRTLSYVIIGILLVSVLVFLLMDQFYF